MGDSDQNSEDDNCNKHEDNKRQAGVSNEKEDSFGVALEASMLHSSKIFDCILPMS